MKSITEFQDLQAAAKALATQLRAGEVVGLSGALGAGKTTFVKELAKALGVRDEVISPTFVYHQTYELPVVQRGIQRLHHLDLYRITRDSDLDDLGIDVSEADAVYLVEWIEHAPDLAARAHRRLRLVLNTDGTRTLEEA